MRERSAFPVVFRSALMLLLVAAACGAPAADEQEPPETPAVEAGGETPSSDGVHVCDLFSTDEAGAVLEREVAEPEVSAINPVSRSSECEFEAVDGTRVLVVQLERLSNPEARAVQHRELFSDATTVEGLGDQALYSASQLLVIAGDHQLVVTVGGFMGAAADQRMPKARSVAETVLSRLEESP